MAPASHAKVHSAAVAVVPPTSVWRPIQAIRCLRDKSFVRWPPHINLLYPFYEDAPNAEAPLRDGRASTDRSDFRQLALRASRALSGVAPFRVRLERLRTFSHSARSFTVWADPVTITDNDNDSGGVGGNGGSGEGLLEVQRLLEAEFPECHDLSRDEGRGIDGFVPHLSLGQLRDESELQALQDSWTPLEFTVDSVQLISRRGYMSPFTIRYQVPLGRRAKDAPAVLLAASAAFSAVSTAPAASSSTTGVSAGVPYPLSSKRPPAPPGSSCTAHLLDVPYVATLANLAVPAGSTMGGARGPRGAAGGGTSSSGVECSLGARYASPTLVRTSSAGSVSADAAAREGGEGKANDEGQKGVSGASRKRRGEVCAVVDEAVDAAGADAPGVPGREARGRDGVAEGEQAPATAGRGHTGREDCGEDLAAAMATDRGPGEPSGSAVDGAGGGGDGGDGGRGGSGSRGRGGGASVWWFAYGAAAAVEVAALGAEEALPASVPGYRLAFNRRGGRANIVPAAAAEAAAGLEAEAAEAMEAAVSEPEAAQGVLFRLPVQRMARLLLAVNDASPVEVLCHPYGGKDPVQHAPVAAVAFAVPPEGCLAQEAAPAAGYVAALERACCTYGIDPAFERWLSGLATGAQDAWEPRVGGARNGHAGSGGHEGADGHGGSRSGRAGSRGVRGAFRTGAKKAVAGLPREVLDW